MPVETLDISVARNRFNTLDRDLEEQPVIFITRHGKDAFAVVNIEYLQTVLETMDVLSDPEATALLDESIRAIQEGQLIDQEDVEEELG